VSKSRACTDVPYDASYGSCFGCGLFNGVCTTFPVSLPKTALCASGEFGYEPVRSGGRGSRGETQGMSRPSWHLMSAMAILIAGLPSCARVPVEQLPDAQSTLAQVGRRLGSSRSVDDLSAIAAKGDRIVAELSRPERDALGRGYLRFQVDRPAILDVAAD